MRSADTIVPQSITIDESLSYPALFRTVFKPASSSGATDSISATTTVDALRHDYTHTSLTGPSSVRAGRVLALNARVLPICGPVKLQYRVWKLSTGRIVKANSVGLTEDSTGVLRLTLKSRGVYRIQARFAGNRFGATSPWASKTVVVR